jgi:hypothetical protein
MWFCRCAINYYCYFIVDMSERHRVNSKNKLEDRENLSDDRFVDPKLNGDLANLLWLLRYACGYLSQIKWTFVGLDTSEG